jgi:hypothetical protein
VRIRLIFLSIGAAIVLLAGISAAADAQSIAPAGVTMPANRGASWDVATTTSTLRRQDLHALDSSSRQRNIVIGALIGAGTGVAIGYGLAFLGRAAYCESELQCSEYPRRAVRESTIAGFLIGGTIGALIGWSID